MVVDGRGYGGWRWDRVEQRAYEWKISGLGNLSQQVDPLAPVSYSTKHTPEDEVVGSYRVFVFVMLEQWVLGVRGCQTRGLVPTGELSGIDHNSLVPGPFLFSNDQQMHIMGERHGC